MWTLVMMQLVMNRAERVDSVWAQQHENAENDSNNGKQVGRNWVRKTLSDGK
jgi:hypothetical protein